MAEVEALLADAEAARARGDYARVRKLTAEICSRPSGDLPEEVGKRARELHESVGGDGRSQVIAAICMVAMIGIFIYYALAH